METRVKSYGESEAGIAMIANLEWGREGEKNKCQVFILSVIKQIPNQITFPSILPLKVNEPIWVLVLIFCKSGVIWLWH